MMLAVGTVDGKVDTMDAKMVEKKAVKSAE